MPPQIDRPITRSTRFRHKGLAFNQRLQAPFGQPEQFFATDENCPEIRTYA
jgi:hypothetical protein